MSSSETVAALSTIKVMIIDDSVLIRKYVTQILSELENIEVVTTAPNGKIGLQKIYLYKPDVVILDIEMPEMTGLELLKYLKKNPDQSINPNIIMFSSLVDNGSDETFEALENGAADFIKKPEGQITDNLSFLKNEFDLKIKELYKTKKEKLERSEVKTPALKEEEKAAPIDANTAFGIENLGKIASKKTIKPELIAIGSSTGGPVAIRKIMDTLGKIPVPMVIAQHMPIGFTGEFAKNLGHIYKREVEELSDGQKLVNGVIYICPGGCHSRIVKNGSDLVYQSDANNYDGFFFKPSVDIFFQSIRESIGKNVLAVVLSGMGKDGSIESVTLRNMGAIILAQDKESSIVWGMPGNSVKNGGVDLVVNLGDMGKAIMNIVGPA